MTGSYRQVLAPVSLPHHVVRKLHHLQLAPNAHTCPQTTTALFRLFRQVLNSSSGSSFPEVWGKGPQCSSPRQSWHCHQVHHSPRHPPLGDFLISQMKSCPPSYLPPVLPEPCGWRHSPWHTVPLLPLSPPLQVATASLTFSPRLWAPRGWVTSDSSVRPQHLEEEPIQSRQSGKVWKTGFSHRTISRNISLSSRSAYSSLLDTSPVPTV